MSYSAYSDWWIDDPIRYSDFNYKTVTRQEGRSYAFTWGTSDGQGGCSDSEWKTGGPTNHYSPMWRSRTVTCQSPWKQYAETLTAFCARPVECPWNCGFGNPIFPASGVKVQLETDYVGAGLKFERRYNSAGHQRYDEFEVEKAIPRFGHFWRHNFSRALWISANASAPGGIGFVWLQRSDMTSYFTAGQITNGVLVLSQRKEQRDRLEAQLDASGSVVQWRYFSPENTMEVYGPSGVPLYLVSANGQTITYDYSQGFAIQTAFGRRLRLLSDGIGRYKALVLPDDSVVTYEYSYPEAQSPLLYTSNLLAAVYPDGARRGYVYGEASLINSSGAAAGTFDHALTGIYDENSVRFASFGYAESGAVSTEHAGGVNKFQWDNTRGQIVDPLGQRRTISYTNVSGMYAQSREYVQAQIGGTTQTVDRTKTFDVNGGLASSTDAAGRMTCYINDLSRNLEAVRVEGLSSSDNCAARLAANAALPAGSRKVSKEWHPVWRLQTRVAEPGRITTYVYNGQPDPFNSGATASCAPPSALLPDGKPIAVLCRQVERATTDANGAAGFSATLDAGVPNREQTWTYNQYGQVLTHDGPRTDVSDITTYAYYSDTSFSGVGSAAVGHTLGDLQSVTNAAGLVTQYTKYDKHGQLLESIGPNGAVTSHTYDLRQRLLSTTVAGQTTSYTYDAAGQLLRITRPDASYIGYEYDAAHRQSAVYDNLGNRIEYTLDNAGNRTGESVKDASGALRSQLARSIDALGRVQQTTGRE